MVVCKKLFLPKNTFVFFNYIKQCNNLEIKQFWMIYDPFYSAITENHQLQRRTHSNRSKIMIYPFYLKIWFSKCIRHCGYPYNLVKFILRSVRSTAPYLPTLNVRFAWSLILLLFLMILVSIGLIKAALVCVSNSFFYVYIIASASMSFWFYLDEISRTRYSWFLHEFCLL